MSHNNANNVPEKLLIFLHIMKTGGTTLTNIICNQYAENIHYRKGWMPSGVLEYYDELEKADSLCGHFWFGVHRYLSRPFTYITLLRDPIEQVISWFYYRYKSQHLDQFNGSLDEYISSNKFNHETVNLQTRFICGDKTSDLERAKENLKKHFTLVGITELFDESVFLMKKELGWENIGYKRVNTNNNRPDKNQILQSTINKIKEKNKMDLELYYFARQILESKIVALDSHSKKELDIFKSSHSN